MAKTMLKITTPIGTFTRATATAYTHAVVWNSPRAMEAFQAPQKYRSGVDARWIKDRGHGVTWHGSEQAARKAAAGHYMWDRDAATLVGIFPVEA